MTYVYMMESVVMPGHFYVGCTGNLKKRFDDHNRGLSPHTRKFAPWRLVTYVAFSDPDKAKRFEAYLKTGSGRTFAKRHF